MTIMKNSNENETLDEEIEELEGELGENDTDDKTTSKKGGKAVKKLVEFLLSSNNVELFVDQFGDSYIAVNSNGSEIIKIDSKKFSRWVSIKTYDAELSFSKETVSKAQDVLSGQAEKNERYLSARVGKDDEGNIYYDLGNKAVKINKDSWEIINNPPIIFQKVKHQKKQMEPSRGGNLDSIFDVLNIKNEEERILLKVYLVSCFIPNFPHPVLVLFGEHGSCKSSAFRFLKKLIDPSSLSTMSAIKEIKEFVQLASHHWFIPLDNLSYLNSELSDCICRICTGEGVSKRRLYSDDDDFIYNFQHIVGINGISNVISKPDLLDRSILIGLESITDKNRKHEHEMNTLFEKIRPLVLGACFDAVAGAMKLIDTITLPEVPRMADFSYWGYAIAETIGIGGKKFISAYKNNISNQNFEAIEASPIGTAIIKMMERTPTGIVEDTPTGILSKLNVIARVDMDTNLTESKFWPKDPRVLTKRIHEIIPNLKKEGIEVIETKGKERMIRFIDINKHKDVQELPEEVPYDITDDKDMPF